jgi:hypothetical protein
MDDATAAMTPDQRLAKDLCCECGIPLAGLDVPHHSANHWVQFIRPDGTNAEAIRRQALLADYAAAHPPITPAPAHTQGAARPSSSPSRP